MLVTVLFIISKLSPPVLIRVWHQKAFKEEGMGVAVLVWPQAAVKACLEVMHTKSWCSSCYLWIVWSHLESELQKRYFSSSVGRSSLSTSDIFLNMNIFLLNHCDNIHWHHFFFKCSTTITSLLSLSPNTLEILNSARVCTCVFEETFKWICTWYVLSEQKEPQI